MNKEMKEIIKRAAFGFVVEVTVFILMVWQIKIIMFASIEKVMLIGDVFGWFVLAVEVTVCGLLLMQVPGLSAVLSLSLMPSNKEKIK